MLCLYYVLGVVVCVCMFGVFLWFVVDVLFCFVLFCVCVLLF